MYQRQKEMSLLIIKKERRMNEWLFTKKKKIAPINIKLV